MIDRREAIRRVSTLLGGVALVGGSGLLTACERERAAEKAAPAPAAPPAPVNIGTFTPQDVAFLDEVADTILPTTAKSPGAKAAKTGAFMALMVTDGYGKRQQTAFREGMEALDAASTKAHGVAFTAATPPQRLALLQALDKEQLADAKRRGNKRVAAKRAPEETSDEAKADRRLPDQRAENAPNPEVGAGTAVDEEDEGPVPHYFRMMKELALLGYFTSEIGYTKAMRYVESPGRFDPCAPYAPGDRAWAPHA